MKDLTPALLDFADFVIMKDLTPDFYSLTGKALICLCHLW
jgi:hypothetical protein